MGIGSPKAQDLRRGTVVLAAALSLMLGLAACTSDSSSSGAKTSSTTGSTTSASASTTSAASAATTSAKPTKPKPTSSTSLGGDCPAVLPLLTVDRAVGKTVPGRTAFIVNLPDYTIGQVERINCQYGLGPLKGPPRKAPSVPLVEASVSLYDSTAHANARVAATTEAWREHGATPHAVTVAGHPAVILVGYGSPLLVLGAGARTMALSVSPTLVPVARRDAVLVSLAASALHGAGG